MPLWKSTLQHTLYEDSTYYRNDMLEGNTLKCKLNVMFSDDVYVMFTALLFSAYKGSILTSSNVLHRPQLHRHHTKCAPHEKAWLTVQLITVQFIPPSPFVWVKKGLSLSFSVKVRSQLLLFADFLQMKFSCKIDWLICLFFYVRKKGFPRQTLQQVQVGHVDLPCWWTESLLVWNWQHTSLYHLQ